MRDNTAAGITLQGLASALGGEISAGQVLAPGPGHSPADRSMSVKLDDSAPDGFVAHSFAGDDAIACKDYVRDKLGMAAWQPNGKGGGHLSPGKKIAVAMAELRKSQPETPAAARQPAAREWVCNYDYRDLGGKLLYQVQRYEPKDFRQRRPDGNGGWITTKVFENISRVPYHYPELAADIAAYPDAPIFCTEGEKDCDSVRALGLFATCVAGSVWTPEIAAILKDRDVIILEDNDRAGREKAAKAGQALHGIAASVRVVGFTDLPEKADVSDWIALDPEKHEDGEVIRTKNNDGREGRLFSYRMEVVVIGIDEDGDEISIAIAADDDPGSRTASRRAGLNKTQRRAMELLDRALIEKGQPPPSSGEIPHGVGTVVSREIWCDYCVNGNLSASGKAESSRRVFGRAMLELIDRHFIGTWKEMVWVAYD